MGEQMPEYEYKVKKRKTRGGKGYVRNFVLKRLQEGRLTDKEIAEECAVLYDGSTSVKAVQWYKHSFRKQGLIPKDDKHRRRRKYLVKLMYEIIFKQENSSDNVEVVDAKTLIEFAKQIVVTYAKALPKPIDEIVYDVRTAKHYLEATGRFQIIDQNDYVQPYTFTETKEENKLEGE